VLNLLVEWIEAGEATVVTADDGRQFPGVRIGDDGVRFFSVPDHPDPVAGLETKSGDHVYMTMLASLPMALTWLPGTAVCGSKQPGRQFGGLVFPMVSLDQEVDISWLVVCPPVARTACRLLSPRHYSRPSSG